MKNVMREKHLFFLVNFNYELLHYMLTSLFSSTSIFFSLKLDEMTSRPFGMPLKLGSDDEEEVKFEDPFARGARKKKF